ncbi:HNH endonuclease [Streptomyces sp. NPDC003077]|uniref:HNH endonuclease n=1 Tax=Streptomyces sp. NPDC003077 TaxID=3154443 RepID=UPI0033A5FA35
MSRHHVGAGARRRTRKHSLVRRDGLRCAYCRRSFLDLHDATIDHVVPLSLFRTWATEHLVLACASCNVRKADRLPLSMALLLCWTTTREHPQASTREQSLTPDEQRLPADEHPAAVRREHLLAGREHPGAIVHEHLSSGVHGHPEGVHERAFTASLTGWLLLARLAHAGQFAKHADGLPDQHDSTTSVVTTTGEAE